MTSKTTKIDFCTAWEKATDKLISSADAARLEGDYDAADNYAARAVRAKARQFEAFKRAPVSAASVAILTHKIYKSYAAARKAQDRTAMARLSVMANEALACELALSGHSKRTPAEVAEAVESISWMFYLYR